jgi:predicted AAA+ superfamily ATPase
MSKILNGITGLKNMGNTCYLNAAIQLISHMPKVMAYLLQNKSSGTALNNLLNLERSLKYNFVKTKQSDYKFECRKKAIEYDIPRLFGVEKVDELKFLFQLLVNENGSLIEFKKIASETGIEENTLKKYISYFEESFLIKLIYNYSRSFRKSKRLQKKVYISSPNFFVAFRSEWFENEILKAQYFGILSETYIFNLLQEKNQYVSFFRKGQDEIDFVVSNDYRDTSQSLIIEVKYTNKVQWNDIKFIDRTAKKIFKKKYLLYSKLEFKIDKDKLFIPCFLVK